MTKIHSYSIQCELISFATVIDCPKQSLQRCHANPSSGSNPYLIRKQIEILRLFHQKTRLVLQLFYNLLIE